MARFLGLQPERPSRCGRSRLALPHASGADARRLRLPAHARGKPEGQRQPRETALARALQYRPGFLDFDLMSPVRRLLQVTAFLCTLAVGAASMAVIVTQTTWFKEWLRAFIVRQAEGYVNGRLSIGRLDGNLFYGVEMQNIAITQNGKPVVDIKDAGLRYDPFTLISGHAVIDTIRLNQP